MKILVFGHGGQVATALRQQAGSDCHIEALSRAEADLAEPQACAARVAATNADVVINAAAYTAVDRAEAEEALATAINGAAPGAMAQAAAARAIPFLHLSTDYVFDGSPGRPWDETDPPLPLSAYGRSKLAGERAVQAAGGPHAILRVAWVFGVAGQNFVRTMLRVGATRDRLTVVDDQLGGPTPAAAIAEALITIARRFAAGAGTSGLFHFCGAPVVSWHGFATEIFARVPSDGRPAVEPIPSAAWPTPAQRPLNSVLDCTRIAQTYGITQPDWRLALDDIVPQIRAEAQ